MQQVTAITIINVYVRLGLVPICSQMTPTNRLSEHWETSTNHWLAKKTFFKDKNMTIDTEKLTKKLMVQKSCKTIGSLSHPIIFTRFYTSIQTVVGLGSSEPSTSSIDFILRDETTRLWAEGCAAAAHTSPGVVAATGVWKKNQRYFELSSRLESEKYAFEIGNS